LPILWFGYDWGNEQECEAEEEGCSSVHVTAPAYLLHDGLSHCHFTFLCIIHAKKDAPQMVNWLTVLLSTLGGTVGAAAVLAALWKFLGTVWADRLRLQIEHDNNEKIEKLRADLQVQTDKAQKLLDAGVQKAILVTRTQFETEFNAYKDIYAVLTEVRYAVVQTRPTWIAPSNESAEEKGKRFRSALNTAFENLATAHNKLVVLRDNLAPFYAAEVYTTLGECISTSKMELFQVRTAGQETFSTPWYADGHQRQQEFIAAHRRVGELIRERIASLGIIER
jgi:hypothetical protein